MSTDDTAGEGDDTPTWVVDGKVWSLADLVNGLKARDARINSLESELAELREELAAVKSENKELRNETEAQWDEIGELDDATDMLQLVEDADKPTAEQARGRIIQHMWRMVRGEEGEDRRYSMTRSKTNEMLSDPEVDRTTINRWMRTTAELVGDESICEYIGGEPGRGGREARLILDLRDTDGVSLPGAIPNKPR